MRYFYKGFFVRELDTSMKGRQNNVTTGYCMVRNCKIVGQISIFFSVGMSLQNFTMKEKTGNL